MLESVHRTLEQFNMIVPGDRVVIGVSGGADSVALLLMLCEYRKEIDFDIEVVHVNHLIREDAGEDAGFVKSLTESKKLNFNLFEVDVLTEAKRRHLSTEEAGRQIRYEMMRSLKPSKIAVGHHSDDLTETVLLNLCRGTGIHGMAGIAPVMGDIIRPLLFTKRKEIEEYLDDLSQSYRTDSTNLTDDYTRNKIRLNVLPYLEKEINEKSSEHIINLSKDMAEIENLINNITTNAYSEICSFNKENSEIIIDSKKLSELDSYIQREVVLKVLEKLTPRRKDITRNHVQNILDIIDKNGEKRIHLPYDLEVVSSYDNLYIRKKEAISKEADIKETAVISREELADGYTLKLCDGRVLKARVFANNNTLSYPESRYTKWFDYDKINGSVMLRNRQEGDYLTVNNLGQKKSLKEYMINEKIPKEYRDEKYILAEGSHVLWVVDHRISAFYKIDEHTANILEVDIK